MGVYLSTPNTGKDSEEGEIPELRYAACSMQGWRMSMEDAHICHPNVKPGIHLFAVFDGHGGREVAKFCALKFVDALKVNTAFNDGKYHDALKQTFLLMDVQLEEPESRKLLQTLKGESEHAMQSYAGCTANVCLVTPETIYCANAGDSRALLFDGKSITELSQDHKPDLETEKKRITKAGGYVAEGRVNENLNLSRAIGDLEYKKNAALGPEEQIITAFPDVIEAKRDPAHKFLLMGCDGIWETLTAENICNRLSTDVGAGHGKLTPAVEGLLDKLIAPDTSKCTGCDNMTCLLVVFK